jgi:hypothetical protein
MRTVVLSITVVWLVACGAKQDVGGPAFCQSYEDNFLATCQAYCEGEHEQTDRDAPQRCRAQCVEDIQDDGTYSDACPEQMKKLK